MERLDRYYKIFNSIGIAIGVVLSNRVNKLLSEYPFWFSIILSLLIISVSFVLFREGFKNIIVRYKALRKWALGRRFVEGSWINSVYKSSTLIHIAVVRIEPDGNSIRISIELYSTSGKPIGRVKSQMVSVQWPDLKYMYKFVRPGNDKPPGNGYAELQFMEKENSCPERYNGFFIDSLKGYRCDFYGRKITGEEEKMLNMPEGRSKLVKAEVDRQRSVRPDFQVEN